MLGPVEARKLSFHLCVLTYRLFALCLYRRTVVSLISFCGPLGRPQDLPVPRQYKECAQKLEYECLIY